jgi:hypothetical protein
MRVGIWYVNMDIKMTNFEIDDRGVRLLTKMVGFAIAPPTLHNTLIFQLLKYLCLTISTPSGMDRGSLVEPAPSYKLLALFKN